MNAFRTVGQLGREIEKLEIRRLGRTLALSSLVGALAGGGAILFQLLSQSASRVFLDGIAGFRAEGPAGEVPLVAPGAGPLNIWLLALVPALGGLIAGWLVTRFAPEASGHGTDAAIDAFHRRGGVIRARVPIIKTLASAITLGTGGSGGREGPIAQIGAGFGSAIAHRLKLRERERRVLLAAGIGAGVGSIFRAPLAGALFAAEVLYSEPEFESEVVIPAAIASIVAFCVYSLKFGFGSLFRTPDFVFHSPLELLPYTVLALVVALAAGVFVKVFYGTHAFFERLPAPRVLRPALGGLATGLIGVGLYLGVRDARALDVLSFGYGSLQHAFLGEVPATLLLMIAAGKLLTTSLSIGSGGSAGVFGPSMVIGGALGGALGQLGQRLMPEVVTQPGAYVAVGMAGFFAAAANTPISTLVMVSEITGSYHLLLPSLWVCAIAYLLGRRWNLYRSQVPTRSASPAHRGALYVEILRDVRVRDVIGGRPLHTVPPTASLREVIEVFTASSQNVIPLVDSTGRMSGIVSSEQVREILDGYDQNAPLIAQDLAVMPPAVVSPEDDLETALRRLDAAEAEELPVVEVGDDGRVMGILSRRDLLALYNRHRHEQMQAAAAGTATGGTATGGTATGGL